MGLAQQVAEMEPPMQNAMLVKDVALVLEPNELQGMVRLAVVVLAQT